MACCHAPTQVAERAAWVQKEAGQEGVDAAAGPGAAEEPGGAHAAMCSVSWCSAQAYAHTLVGPMMPASLFLKPQRPQRAMQELQEVGPPPYPDGRGYAVQRKWSNLFEGADFFLSSILALALTTPGYTLRDFNEWLDGQFLSAGRLVPQTSALKAEELDGDFALPVIVIQGAEDFTQGRGYQEPTLRLACDSPGAR